MTINLKGILPCTLPETTIAMGAQYDVYMQQWHPRTQGRGKQLEKKHASAAGRLSLLHTWKI